MDCGGKLYGEIPPEAICIGVLSLAVLFRVESVPVRSQPIYLAVHYLRFFQAVVTTTIRLRFTPFDGVTSTRRPSGRT